MGYVDSLEVVQTNDVLISPNSHVWGGVTLYHSVIGMKGAASEDAEPLMALLNTKVNLRETECRIEGPAEIRNSVLQRAFLKNSSIYNTCLHTVALKNATLHGCNWSDCTWEPLEPSVAKDIHWNLHRRPVAFWCARDAQHIPHVQGYAYLKHYVPMRLQEEEYSMDGLLPRVVFYDMQSSLSSEGTEVEALHVEFLSNNPHEKGPRKSSKLYVDAMARLKNYTQQWNLSLQLQAFQPDKPEPIYTFVEMLAPDVAPVPSGMDLF